MDSMAVRQAVRFDIEAFGGRRDGHVARGQVASDVPLENIAPLFEAVLNAFG